MMRAYYVNKIQTVADLLYRKQKETIRPWMGKLFRQKATSSTFVPCKAAVKFRFKLMMAVAGFTQDARFWV